MPYISPNMLIYGSDGTGGFQEKGTAYPFVVDGYGTAGSPAGGVVSVQGVANGTPQPISGTVSSKTQDGYGIQITSTLTGSKRGLSVSVDGYAVPFFPVKVVSGSLVASDNAHDGYGNIVTSTIAGPKRGFDENISSWLGSTAPSIGSKASVSSIPVVIASDQSSFPTKTLDGYNYQITSTLTGSKRGLSVSLDSYSVATFPTHVTNPLTVSNKVSTSIDGYSVSFVPVRVTGTVPATQSGTWSDRILDGYGNILTSTIAGAKRGLDENLSSWLGSTAPTVGSKTSANSIPVVIASDQSQTSNTGNCTNVSAAVASTLLLTANTARISAMVFNDSNSVLYLKFASGASTTSFTIKMAAGSYYEVPTGQNNKIYNGAIYGYWASANGAARITEVV